MSVMRLPEDIWRDLHRHLFSGPGEHFGFMLAEPSQSVGEPVFIVKELVCVQDRHTKLDGGGWSVTPEGYLLAVNAAVRRNAALIEAHNHGGTQPRFSHTDRQGLTKFVPYILDSLPGRPYAATVWGDSTVYGEFFAGDGSTGGVRSITAIGGQFRQLVSRDDDYHPVARSFGRQLPWFTEQGQQALGRVRIGVVGGGGTGSHVLQQLTYLGIRDFLIVEHDSADETSMNRLITATAADVETSKAILGRRLIKSVAPSATVTIVPAKVQSKQALDALKGVDLVFGCVDNDGARLILNELSRAYAIPYFDMAVGIDVDTKVVSVGGRVAVVAPGGPCLQCMKEIDRREAYFFLADRRDQEFQLERGYVRGIGVRAPSVVSLNGAVAAMAVNEFAVFVSGLRPPTYYTELDLLGVGRAAKGQWVSPRRNAVDPGCVACTLTGVGDRAALDRYIDREGALKV